jgi:hypothetical protein
LTDGDKAKSTVDAEVAAASTNTDDKDEDDNEDNHAPENVQTYLDFGRRWRSVSSQRSC